MSRSSWYLNSVKPISVLKWTPEMRVSVYTMRVNEEMSISEIQNSVEESLGKRPNKIRIYNVLRMMRKSLAKCCYCCGKHLPKSKKAKGHLVICRSCQKKRAEYWRKIREGRIKKKVCGVCGEFKVFNGFTACKSCISGTYRRRIIQGICGYCGERPLAPNSMALCEPCMELNRLKGQLHRKKTNA